MTRPRTLLAIPTSLALLAGTAIGCSAHTATGTASTTATPRRTTAAPARTSAFCLDLTTFQVALVTYKSDVGGALEGKRLDFKELRRKAALITNMGKEMRASAPPGIAADFRTVLKGVRTSAGKLKRGSTVGDVVEPLYGKHNEPAFDAVDKYQCR